MMENLVTYLWILALVFAVVMIFIGGLRWIANSNKRKERLNIISICALIFFVLVLVFYNWEKISGIFLNSAALNDDITISLVNVFKIAIKVLVIVIIAVFSLILSFMAILLVVYSVKAIYKAFIKKDNAIQLKKSLQEETAKITVLLKTPVFIVSIVGGILALYLLFPIIIGKESPSLVENWKDGVTEIVSLCTNATSEQQIEEQQETNEMDSELSEVTGVGKGNKELVKGITTVKKGGFVEDLSVYTLVFILIIGIGYGVVNILFEIIKERFEKKTIFLSEYSNAIGLLAVGISILLLISSLPYDTSKKNVWNKIAFYAQPFVTVIFVIALGILILEIVRLLIDMREKMIRKEARYLFVLVVGLCTVIIMKAFLIVYGIFISILGKKNMQLSGAEERIQEICEQILEKVSEDMEEEMEADSRINDEIPYNTFKGKSTKK